MVDDILAHTDAPDAATASAFAPTFSSSRYERIWILNYLGPFYDKGEIADVLRKVKGGKEANVYCCSGGPNATLELIAAKVYRPRQFRNLRNDALYRQGREIMGPRGEPVRDRRALHAIQMGTRKGKEMQHVSWLAHEYATLQLLHAAGVRVPKPVAFANNTILMEYVGETMRPAPTLQSVVLTRKEAVGLFDSLMADVERMLSQRSGARRPVGVQRALLGRRLPDHRLPADRRSGRSSERLPVVRTRRDAFVPVLRALRHRRQSNGVGG